MKSLCLNSMIRFFSLLFVLNLLTFSTIKAQCDPVGDSLALVAFYNAAGGNLWTHNDNWLVGGQAIETWYGISVNDEGCVLKIDLPNNYVKGFIPPELANLSIVNELRLNHNRLEGSIPPELSNLIDLRFLNLSSNRLTGSIPAELSNLINLKTLALSYNQLTGNIPPELGGLMSLNNLNLGWNELSGSIPNSLGNLDSLFFMFLWNNELTGSIPAELGNLINLEDMLLGSNQLSGTIPPELGNLGNLKTLWLELNELTESIPVELSNLQNLENLDLSLNQISGEIPAEIGNLQQLEYLNLYKNNITGSIPTEIGNLQQLQSLDLRANNITGSIPAEIGNLQQLQSLDLSDNNITGSIPTEIWNLIQLIELTLGKNTITGSISPEIGNLLNLRYLDLYKNQLTGSIPTELGSLLNLQYLYLYENQITGSIPTAIGNLENLEYLYFNENQLSGNIPRSLGNLSNLKYLYLQENQLSGGLPIELANLENLLRIRLTNNQLSGCIPPQYTVFCDLGFYGVDFTGNTNLPNNGDFNPFCENQSGACAPTIIGDVVFDETENCEIDASEVGLQNWLIRASSINGTFYGVSDPDGHYSIYTYPGEYTVELITSLIYWGDDCTGSTVVSVLDTSDIQTVNFLPSIVIECPYLTVDISTPLLRRCFPNTYAVNYCNNGTISAEDAFVEILFDDLITVDSASIDISSQVGNVFTFNLGNLGVNDCGSFKVYTKVTCGAVNLGQTLCATAHIYPDTICSEIAPEWSGATVEVEGDCDGNEVHFTIKNTGEGDMLTDQTYIVIEDGIILLAAPESFSLDSNNDLLLTYPANGSTYICQATQVNNHPIETMPTAFVEACGTNEEGEFSIGYVTQFPENDNAPFVSIDCQEVIGSFDPNDKRGFPKGYGEEHFIERGQDIDYHIRFQNTGTDTAFTVIVEDVLSPNLEMISLRIGASSHPYTLEIQGSDTLRFIFNDILLPDSTINEVASHGFLKFSISQKTDLPLNSVIENTAAIFFDFNDPVLTNTTIHTIGEQFVEVVAVQNSLIPFLNVSVAPNPIVDQAIIRIDGVDFKNAKLSLLNNLGIMFREETFDGNEFLLKKGDLSAGIYFFEIIVDGQKGFVGKLIVN